MTQSELLKLAVLKQTSDLGFCAIDSQVFKIVTLKTYKLRFIRDHNLFVLKGTNKVYTPVILSKTSEQVLWMDCITGAFIHFDGRRSGLPRLEVELLEFDQEKGKKLLLERNNYRSRVYDKLHKE